MKNDTERLLEQFYNKLKNNVQRKRKKIEENSLLLTFIATTKNNAREYLISSSINSGFIPDSTLNILLDQGLIRQTDLVDDYALTAKGIYEYEKEKKIVNIEKMIKFLDGRKYDFFGKIKKISDRHKIILFSMIVVRTFSERSVVDLKVDKKIREIWEETIERCYDLLNDLGVVSEMSKKELFGQSKADPPIVNLFRHTEALPRRTKMIFKRKSEGLNYFLNVYDGSTITIEKLAFIFWLIFENNLIKDDEPNMANIKKISNFCRDISSEKDIYLFDPMEHIFSNPKYDKIITKALIKSVIMRRKWEKSNR